MFSKSRRCRQFCPTPKSTTFEASWDMAGLQILHTAMLAKQTARRCLYGYCFLIWIYRLVSRVLGLGRLQDLKCAWEQLREALLAFAEQRPYKDYCTALSKKGLQCLCFVQGRAQTLNPGPYAITLPNPVYNPQNP